MSCSRSCPLVGCENMELLLTNPVTSLIYDVKGLLADCRHHVRDHMCCGAYMSCSVLLILMTENTATNYRLSKLHKSRVVIAARCTAIFLRPIVLSRIFRYY